MPIRCLLVRVGDAECGGFRKRLRDDLQADWQVTLCETTGERDGRKTGEIEGVSKARAQILFIWVHGIKRLRWTRRSRSGEEIHTSEVCANLLVQYASGA